MPILLHAIGFALSMFHHIFQFVPVAILVGSFLSVYRCIISIVVARPSIFHRLIFVFIRVFICSMPWRFYAIGLKVVCTSSFPLNNLHNI